jgi:cardiolipin synthase
VIDGVWSTVGSTNLDGRSSLFNQEVNAIVLGRDFAQRRERAFARDRAASRRIAPDAWHERPLSQRAMEWIAARLGYWW